MKVAIMTDSNSGITQNEAKQMNIKVVPMPFTIDGEEYLEDITLTQEGFYEKLANNANVSTSQPSVGLIMSIWDELLESYDQIVYIPMSSGLSDSCKSATASAEANYKGKVFVVNNQRISVTQRLSVYDAIELANLGKSGEEIKQILEEVKMQSDIYIMVDTLKYLKKGGRITPAAALAGGVLKIKPILLIKGEKLDKYRMLNRTVANAKRIMLDQIKENINGYLKDIDGDATNVNVAIAYSGVDLTDANDLLEMVKKEWPEQEILCNPLSLSVSCHIGPGALALAVVKKLPLKYLK